MNIIGPDILRFAVPNFEDCCQFLTDYGLMPQPMEDGHIFFSALDGTGIALYQDNATQLPEALSTGSALRQQVYGVESTNDLEMIYTELSSDREVKRLEDGSLETQDDCGFSLKFQVTIRQPLSLEHEKINAPGAEAQRQPNELGLPPNMVFRPRTLSHVVLFVPDASKATDFYCQRLGFQVTDVLLGAGSFLRPKANDDHHTLFMIETPPFMQGIEHFAFHMAGPTEVIIAGTRFIEAGYQPFWGPGRHNFGSNWFWYFNSPLGCHVEYDADMDKHDERWQPRQIPFSAEASQRFLLQYAEKWAPGADKK